MPRGSATRYQSGQSSSDMSHGRSSSACCWAGAARTRSSMAAYAHLATRSACDALTRLDREVVLPALTDLEHHAVPLLRGVARLDSGDHRLAAQPIGRRVLAAGQVAIDVGVRAEFLEQV